MKATTSPFLLSLVRFGAVLWRCDCLAGNYTNFEVAVDTVVNTVRQRCSEGSQWTFLRGGIDRDQGHQPPNGKGA